MSNATSQILESALRKGAGQRSGVHLVLGIFLVAPAFFIALALIPHLAGGDFQAPRARELVPMALLGALTVTGVVLIVKALRSRGPRGTRVGRTVLEDPERVFSVKSFERQIRVNGVPVRKVHVVAISIDQGDELELHLQPHEIPAVMDALKQTVGPHVIST